jgi:hypothetical protein
LTPAKRRMADTIGLTLTRPSKRRRLKIWHQNRTSASRSSPKSPPPTSGRLSTLSNRELLSTLDLTLLELERRLYRYAHEGEELIYMADEGLLLAARAGARLGQALSAAEHAVAHLQVVGVGEWHPTSTRPAWDDEPRLAEEDSLTEEGEEDS